MIDIQNSGIFVLSLDFEMMWGSAGEDRAAVCHFRKRVAYIDQIINRLLCLFEKYHIHATWAVVGAIGCENREEIERRLSYRLVYEKTELDMNAYVQSIGADEDQDPCHFGKRLLERIRITAGQHIGSHTFTHFFAGAFKGDPGVFQQELLQSKEVLEGFKKNISSFVFPKNQTDGKFYPLLLDLGFSVIRGKQRSRRFNKEGMKNRILRFADAYVPLCGRNDYGLGEIKGEGICDVRASRFYRTYDKRLAALEFLKTMRIKKEMTRAACDGRVYHLWCHPHNFGSNVERSLSGFEEILKHFEYLHRTYAFLSLSMEECAELSEELGG